MRLFVANLTAQKLVFAYVMPDEDGKRNGSGHRTQDIPMGGQVMVSGDLTQQQIDVIIKHHRKYGMLSASEVADRRASFAGTCYSIDRPVAGVEIKNGIEHNIAVLAERGKQYRQEAAVAVNNALELQLQEQGRPEGLRELAMSVVEEEPSGGYRTAKPLGEGVIVSRDGDAPTRSQRRRGQQRAA
jgi:hypothetical protein